MKLRYFLKNKKKVYTLKALESDKKTPTKDAHHKFIKLRDAPPSR